MSTPAPPEAENPSAAAPPPEGPRARRRAWRRVLLLSPLFFLVGLVLTVVELPYLLPAEVVRDEVVRAVTEATGAEFEIRKLTYDPLSGLALEGVRLGPPEGFTEDVFSASKIAVGYDLSSALAKKVRVESVTLLEPRFVLETRGGRTNVDALVEAALRAYPPGPPSPEPPPTRGPLVPVDVLLDGLEIGPLSVRLVGEGPVGEISQVWLRASGHAGREDLDIEARLETRAAPAPNIDVRLPPADGQPAVQATGDLGLGLDLAVQADTHDGLALKRVRADLGFDPNLEVALDGRALPPIQLASKVGVELEAAKDRLQVAPLALQLSGAPVLDGTVDLEGLVEALEGQLGFAAGAALAASLGLPRTGAPARLGVDLRALSLPLEQVTPYARIFEPGAKLAGRVGVKDLRVSSDPKVLLAGSPEQADGAVSFEHVQVRLPRRGVALGDLDGRLDLGRAKAGAGFGISGSLALSEVAAPGVTLRAGTLGLEGALPKLGYPLPGRAALGLLVGLEGVEADAARLEHLSLSAAVSGEDLLGATREGLAPITATVGVSLQGVVARTGTAAPYRVSSMFAELTARPDRLLAPSRADVPVGLAMTVARAEGPGRLDVRGAKVDAKLTVQDPRLAVPGATRGFVKLEARTAAQGDLQVSGLSARLDARASRATELGAGALDGVRVPRALRAALRARIRRLSGRGALEGLDTEVGFAGVLEGRPGVGDLDLTEIAFDLGDALSLVGEVGVRRGLLARPHATVRLDLERAHLGPLVAGLPRSSLAGFEDAVATGEMQAGLRFDGDLHHLDQEIDLRSPPITLDAKLTLQGVGLKSASHRIELAGLEGQVAAELADGGATFADTLQAARFEVGEGADRRAVLGASIRQHLGYAEGEWSVGSEIEVDKVTGARLGADEVSGLGSKLLVLYPTGGDLQVPTFTLRAASAGVDVQASARLRRAELGMLEPHFALKGWADFDRLRALVPELSALSGRMAAEVSLAPREGAELDLSGALQLDGFGYLAGPTQVQAATGRIPLNQTLALPEPVFDPKVAGTVGRLGDDLEARIEELVRRVESAKGLVSTQDVLLVPPRHADHDALRPFRRREGADLRAQLVRYDRYRLEDVVAEAQWSQGMLRLDHFEGALWGGDLLTDMVVQVTPDLDVRARIRGTVTNLNLDIPYTVAAGKPASEASTGDEYETSATMDLSFALKTRSLDGRIEVTKLSQALVERLYGGLDLSGASGALQALSLSERVGVRPVAAKIWIAQNLLNVQFDWNRLWLHVYYDSWSPLMLFVDTTLIFLRPLLIPTLGGLYVIPTVNGAVYRLSLSGFIDPILESYQPEARLRLLSPYVGAL